jgi:hypothetical protein
VRAEDSDFCAACQKSPVSFRHPNLGAAVEMSILDKTDPQVALLLDEYQTDEDFTSLT